LSASGRDRPAGFPQGDCRSARQRKGICRQGVGDRCLGMWTTIKEVVTERPIGIIICHLSDPMPPPNGTWQGLDKASILHYT
jgi:hypothetical protein